jgi:integrase/recombinase XerD
MKLPALVESYISLKRAMGMRFGSQAMKLRQFARRLGDIDVKRVDPKIVLRFLYGSKIVTTSWHQTYWTLNAFYRYAMARGYVESSPLPALVPKRPEYAPPYIYSVDEIKALLECSAVLSDKRHRLGAFSVTMFRTLLLLLYGGGLRISEALSLRVSDVDLSNSLLIVRNTKFFKSRLLPIGAKLTVVLRDFLEERNRRFGQPGTDDRFFLTRLRKAVSRQTAERYFTFVREKAGVRRSDGAHNQPRLHDLRSSFAVHRLMAWYRQGENVQKLLPQLSTYLGHVNISDTQVYLRMTPELLREANLRFERYALSEVRHAR